MPGFHLQLWFDDGTERTIDFEPVLRGSLFGVLRDPALFAQVRVNEATGTIEWPNGADFNPVVLHDWPLYAARVLAERRAWYPAAGEG
jgi:hypothetical protein